MPDPPESDPTASDRQKYRASEPTAPDLPKYIREPLQNQSPERLDRIASFASKLAAWKRKQRDQELQERREEDAVDDEDLEEIEEQGHSSDHEDYDDVPSNAYITVKEPKEGYRYYYWQWREGDKWKNKYIAPVDPKR